VDGGENAFGSGMLFPNQQIKRFSFDYDPLRFHNIKPETLLAE
jgi:hypothetical protein